MTSRGSDVAWWLAAASHYLNTPYRQAISYMSGSEMLPNLISPIARRNTPNRVRSNMVRLGEQKWRAATGSNHTL